MSNNKRTLPALALPAVAVAISVFVLKTSTTVAQAPPLTEAGREDLLGTPVPTGMSREQLFGTVLRNSLWPNKSIKVCWENASAADAQYRMITRRAAEETWERHSAVRFTGWGPCSNDAEGIRIRIADEGPHVKALGRFLDKRPQGMVLNFNFGQWSPSCQQNREFCVYAVAAHEFGHALGFAHEQNRPDAPSQCRNDHHQGTTGDYNVTRYDAQSIMNYCNPRWNGDGRLSELDIEAVQTVYGRP